MRVLALGAALLWASLSASASSAPAFSCVFGDGAFLLAVDPSPPYGYAVTSRGAAFLENGTLAVAVGGAASGAFLSPGSGLAAAGPPAGGSGADALGAYTFFSVPWAGANVSFVANFTCYRVEGK